MLLETLAVRVFMQHIPLYSEAQAMEIVSRTMIIGVGLIAIVFSIWWMIKFRIGF